MSYCLKLKTFLVVVYYVLSIHEEGDSEVIHFARKSSFEYLDDFYLCFLIWSTPFSEFSLFLYQSISSSLSIL